MMSKYIADDLPIEASFGSIIVKSLAGSELTFYTYIHPAWKPHPLSEARDQIIICVDFIKLVRSDKIHFHKWDDFELYSTDESHALLRYLCKNGFEIYVRSRENFISPNS
jgi:hypothetical protein